VTIVVDSADTTSVVFRNAPQNLTQMKEAIRDAVTKRTIELTQNGVRAARKGRGYLGAALDCRRPGYIERRDKTVASVVAALGSSPGGKHAYGIEFDKRKILCVPATVLDALSIAAARELAVNLTYALTSTSEN
jgi:hypothetical protein